MRPLQTESLPQFVILKLRLFGFLRPELIENNDLLLGQFPGDHQTGNILGLTV